MKLSDELNCWRVDRPSEWKMDEFIRKAQALESAIEQQEEQVVGHKTFRNEDRTLRHKQDDGCDCMRLSELIHELDRVLEVLGDVDVKVRNEAGKFSLMSNLGAVRPGRD